MWFRCSEANTKTPQYEWLGPGAGISLHPAGEAPAERAAQCAAPTDETDSSAAGDRKGRPYSVFGDHPRVLWGPDTGRPAEGRKPPRAGGAHPRVASLSLRPIHLQPLPYGVQEGLPELGRGGPWASRRGRTASQEPTLIRLACARRLLPRREKAYGRLIAAPTGENGPEALARPNQARGRNRNSRNSGTVRAQWPGRNFDCHSDFARRKFP